MAPIVANLREWAALAPSLPADQDRAEVRILSALLTTGFVISLFEPMFYLFAVPASLISRVAALAPSIWCVVAAFGLCLLAALPHLFILYCRPRSLAVQWPRKAAASAAIGAAVIWLYLGTLALPLDVGGLEWAYWLRTLGSLVVGCTYGFSVNAQQIREAIDDKAN